MNKLLGLVLLFTCLFYNVLTVPVDCAAEQQVLSEDSEEFLFTETLGAAYTIARPNSGNIAFATTPTNLNIPYMDLASQLREKFALAILVRRRFDTSPCADKKVCEYNCNTIFPKCQNQKGFIDFTAQYNQNDQQKLAYNWVCKKNLFSSTNQKTSYFSIIFRILVTSVTGLTETQFETEVPNANPTRYDIEFINWNENKGVSGDEIAVLRALELYKEGLKGFLLLCSETDNGFTDIEAKLDEYENEAKETVSRNNKYEIRSDSTASAEQEVSGWEQMANAINTVFTGAKSKGVGFKSVKASFGIKDKKASYSNFSPKQFFNNRDFNAILGLLVAKGKNDGNLGNNHYAKRVVLYNQLKESLRLSFINMVEGNSEQRDFCQCADYNRFFLFFNHLPASEALTIYGIEKDQLFYQFEYLNSFESTCKAKCPTESKCENGGIKQMNGICTYNLFDIGVVQNQQYPMTYQSNHALKFEMSGNDVTILFTSSRTSGGKVQAVTLGSNGNTKSTITSGNIATNGAYIVTKTHKTETTPAFGSRQNIWITNYDGEIKVGHGSIVGVSTFLSYRGLTLGFSKGHKKQVNLLNFVGFAKSTTAPRSDIINAHFVICSGNGKVKSNGCICKPTFSGNYCENSTTPVANLPKSISQFGGLKSVIGGSKRIVTPAKKVISTKVAPKKITTSKKKFVRR